MLELLVLKNDAECTSRRVKWTSGAGVLTYSFSLLETYAHICPVYANICKYMQIYANICKYMQMYANICKHMQIYANIFEIHGPAGTGLQKRLVGIRYKIDKSHAHLPSGTRSESQYLQWDNCWVKEYIVNHLT